MVYGVGFHGNENATHGKVVVVLLPVLPMVVIPVHSSSTAFAVPQSMTLVMAVEQMKVDIYSIEAS
jgi:hypothetical protein